MIFITAGLVCLIIISQMILKKCWNIFKNNSKFYKLPQLPMKSYPLFGHSLSFPKDSTKFFRFFETQSLELAKRNDKMGVFWIGIRPNLLLIHPNTAEVFLKSRQHLSKSANYDPIKPWIKEGLVTSSGRKWQQRRKLITPTFHYDILKDFLQVINEQAVIMIDIIDDKISNNEKVNISKHLKLCTLDVICETAMGCQINAQKDEENEYVKAIHKLSEIILRRLTSPILSNDFIFNLSPTGKEQAKTLNVLHSFTASVIKNRLKNEKIATSNTKQKTKKAFLDMIINAETENGKKLSADDIQEEVDTFMFAGHDTSSTALTWAIYLLGRYPDKQQKLHDELDAIFDGDKSCDITTDHLAQLVYLDLVIKEVLRLYPPVAFIGRNTDEEVVIEGKKIPKGSDLSIFVYFINRHPDLWQEPSKFIPERFDVENRLKKNLSPFAYIPFSAGPRNCIGQRFAIQEMKVILTKFFRQFSVVSLDEEKDITVLPSLILEIVKPLNLELKKRL